MKNILDALIDLLISIRGGGKGSPEIPSPKPRTSMECISYDPTAEVLTVEGIGAPVWITSVADTNSMDGLIDMGIHVILSGDFKHDDLIVGDVVLYCALPYQTVLHQIVEIGTDDKGWFCRTKAINPVWAPVDPYILRKEHVLYLYRGSIC